MTINQIFDNAMYGEEYTKNKEFRESVENNYDDTIDVFYASKRIRDIASPMDLTEAEEKKINRLISKLNLLEEKLETGKPMSEPYRKVESTAVVENLKELQEEITKTRKIDAERVTKFGKIIGTAKYFVENNIDSSVVLKPSTNPYLNKVINEESEQIKTVI